MQRHVGRMICEMLAQTCYSEIYNNPGHDIDYQDVSIIYISLLKLRHSYSMVAIVLCAFTMPNFQTRILEKLWTSVPIPIPISRSTPTHQEVLYAEKQGPCPTVHIVRAAVDLSRQ